MIIQVLGDTAKELQDGDILEAKVTSVEGRKVVNLIPKKTCTMCGKLLRAIVMPYGEIEHLCIKDD